MRRDDWNARYAEQDLIWSAEANRFLVEEVQNLQPGRALDAGCGEGRNAVWLAERGWTVTGVDFSDVAIGKAEAMAARRGVDVEWVVDDLSEYVPAKAHFDLVVQMYLHVPSPNRERIWTRLAEAVAPGGTLLVVGHDLTNLDGGYGGPSRPEVLFTPDDVTSVLDDFEILRSERVIRTVEREGVTHQAIDALVRAMKPR